MLRILRWGVQSCVSVVFQVVLFQSFCILSVLAGLCTKAIKVETQSKKVNILRRLPAACSNWDKSWSWLTKVDCGTKYRLDYVTVPPREAVKYRIEYGCCAGDTNCERGTSDEKFLAIILGSTAAALLILVLVITISLCRKRRPHRCPVVCEGSPIYETADDNDEGAELHGNGERDICTDETRAKVCDPEYEEIRDCKRDKGGHSDDPPRYTDLFNDKQKLAQELEVQTFGDAFNRATAPPLGSEDPESQTQNSGHSDVQEVLSGTAKILATEKDTLQCAGDDGDRIYYNVASEESSDMQGATADIDIEAGISNGNNSCAKQDCKSNSDCSNYDKLIEPDTLSEVDCHVYQPLFDISDATSQNVNANESKCTVEPSPTQVTMNGHLEAASC